MGIKARKVMPNNTVIANKLLNQIYYNRKQGIKTSVCNYIFDYFIVEMVLFEDISANLIGHINETKKA